MIEGLLVATAIFFFRPMVLGYSVPEAGIVLCAIAIIYAITLSISRISVDRVALKVFILAISSNLLTAGVAGFTIGLDIALNTIVIGAAANTAMLIVIGRGTKMALTAIKAFLTIIVFSSLLTAAISSYDFYEIQRMAYLSFPIRDRKQDMVDIMFPLSTVPFRMTLPGLILPRFTFLSIEPGVAVFVLIVWRYLYVDVDSRLTSFFLDTIFLIALALTASTSAPLIATFWFLFRFLYYRDEVSFKSILIAAFFLILGVAALFFLPFFGVFDKMQTHGASFENRIRLYTDEMTLLRVISVILSFLILFYVRKYLPRKADAVLASAAVVSVLNVLALTPLFFFAIFLARAMERQNVVKLHSKKYQRSVC